MLKNVLAAELFRLVRYVTMAIVVLSCVAALLGWLKLQVVVLTGLLVIADSWRSAALGLTNAAQQHRRYALWVAVDTWLRAVLAVAAVMLVDASVTTVIAAYLLAAILLSPLSQRILPLVFEKYDADAEALRVRFWSYAVPLLPLGLIGWVTGLADRYVIGATLSVADAGIYAAAAGLASRPILMLGTAIELMIRPKYQQAVSNGDVVCARHLLRRWLAALAGLGALLVMIIAYWSQHITAVLLGADFRGGAVLLPWVAAGYLLLVLSYVFERVCYAHGRTQRVLSIQIATACAAILCLCVGAYCFGLMGAALAVPAYYSIQLVASIRYAWLTQREHPFVLSERHG